MATNGNGNGGPKWLGITAERWVQIVQTLGIPTLFMLFVCFVAYQNIPRIVESHVNLLKRTGDTLEAMDVTLQQSNATLEQLAKTSEETKAFMQLVIKDHALAQESLDRLEGKKTR